MLIAAVLLLSCVQQPPCERILATLDTPPTDQPAIVRLQQTADALSGLSVSDPETAERVAALSEILVATAAHEQELIEIRASMAEIQQALAVQRERGSADEVAAQLSKVTALLNEMDALQVRLERLGKQIAARHVERAGQEAWLRRRCAP